MYELEETGFDPYLNPLVDIDPFNSSMVTVPIIDLYGTVVGCLQLVAGPNSPKLKVSSQSSENKIITFTQSALWLTHQVLDFLIS
jgi:hypothetical protein